VSISSIIYFQHFFSVNLIRPLVRKDIKMQYCSILLHTSKEPADEGERESKGIRMDQMCHVLGLSAGESGNLVSLTFRAEIGACVTRNMKNYQPKWKRETREKAAGWIERERASNITSNS
jgi:hypothetical protein